MKQDNRKHPRNATAFPIRFNLNPDYHYVPTIKKLGVGGTIHNISWEGIRIDSQMDLLDVCQIFSEELDDDSAFRLEVLVTDHRKRTQYIKGEVRWYRVSEPERNIRHFQAGLYLKDVESQSVTKSMVRSMNSRAMN